jgi:hypothetical protein
MIFMPAMRRAALGPCLAMCGVVHAAAPMPLTVPVQETELVGASTAAATTQETFTISPAADYVVTLTDLQIPAELVSAGVVVTQNNTIAGSGQLAAPATNATVSLPAASGIYTLYVFGVPNANYSVGTFTVCVALKASPSNCIAQTPTKQTLSFAGNITAPDSSKMPTVSTLSTQLSVTTAGSYAFNFADLSFPVALAGKPQVALFQGSTPIIPPGQTTPGITAGTSLTLGPGTYDLLAIAQADPTVQEGLYGITIAAPGGGAPLLSEAVPVGLLPAAGTVSNPSAQNVTLTVADYGFPGPLASASALLTSGASVLGSASSAGGAQSFAAPEGPLSLWTYGAMGSTAGTFSADVSGGGTDLYTAAQGVGPSGTTFAYAYVTSVTTAGTYQATATDLQFPSQLAGLSFAVAQDGVILQSSTTAATLNFKLSAGNAVVLVSAEAPTSSSSPNGLFDVNIQSSPASAAPLFDQTQNVSSSPSLFNTQTLSVTDSSSYAVTLADLKFPVAFDSLALVVTRGSEVLGKIFGAGTFSFNSSPGTYQLTFVASPSADQLFGLYGLSVAYAPPTVTLTSNESSAAAGSTITLSFSSTNATSCTASGGWTGSEPTTASTATETLSATTTYTLTCTGSGGTAAQSVTVTATAAPSKSGGGAVDVTLLLAGLALLGARLRRRSPQMSMNHLNRTRPQ